jgi:leader peptidase (prepilin peptidase)/N-methyltransferase
MAVEPADGWRAACPGGHPLLGPAGGWLGLARCTDCGTEVAASAPAPAGSGTGAVRPATAPVRSGNWYGPRTGLIAAVIGAGCAALAAAAGPRPELAVWLLLTPFALVLALVDLSVHRLPDVLTLSLPGAAVALLGGAALLPGSAGSWLGALLGGVALAGAYVVLFVIHPNGMGFGDVKLALTLGVVLGWYGWTVLFVGAFAGFLLGAVYGLGLMLARRASRKTAMPFGPFMLLGAFLGLLLGGLVGAS